MTIRKDPGWTYEITFNASPSTVGASAGAATGGASSGEAVTGGAASTAGAKKGGKTTKFKGNVAGALGKKPEAVLDATQQQPCVQL